MPKALGDRRDRPLSCDAEKVKLFFTVVNATFSDAVLNSTGKLV